MFNFNRTRNKFRSACKACSYIKGKVYSQSPKRIMSQQKYHNLSEKYKTYQKNYKKSEKYKLSQAKYRKLERVKEKIKGYQEKYRKSDKYKNYLKSDDKKKSNERYLKSGKANEYRKNRRKNDIQYKLSLVLRERLNQALRTNQKKGSAIRDLGCTIAELKVYLEKQFTKGMSWANHGEWHIDHIIPLGALDLQKREELLRGVHYTNLQPLWALENIVKRKKIYAKDMSSV